MCLPTLSWNLVLWCASLPFPGTYCCDVSPYYFLGPGAGMCLPTFSWDLILGCAPLPFPRTCYCYVSPYLFPGPGAGMCLPTFPWDMGLGCASLPFTETCCCDVPPYVFLKSCCCDVPPYVFLGPGAVMCHPTFSWDLVPWCASLPFPSSRHPWASFLVFFCPIFVFICFEVLACIIPLANQLLSWSSVWYSGPQFLLLHAVDRVFFLKPNSENANILLPEDKSIPKHQWFFKDYPVSFKFLRKPHPIQNQIF